MTDPDYDRPGWTPAPIPSLRCQNNDLYRPTSQELYTYTYNDLYKYYHIISLLFDINIFTPFIVLVMTSRMSTCLGELLPTVALAICLRVNLLNPRCHGNYISLFGVCGHGGFL